MEQTIGSNKIRLKNMNRSIILQLIRKRGPITKADIASEAKLTFTTVNNIVDPLLKENLIYETGYDTSSGGRKPVLLTINPNRYYAIGIHFSLSKMIAMVFNFKGEPVAEHAMTTNSNTSIEIIIDQIKQAIQTVFEKSKIKKSDLIGIGIAAPGPLDPIKGILFSPPNFKDWVSVPLKDIIQNHFGVPTFVEKDVNAMAFGEYLEVNNKKINNLLFIDLDIGIGSGIILNGQIYHGFPFGAGEIGHGTIDIDGPRCNCGNYGCLEAVASGLAIVRRLGEELRRGSQSQLKEKYLDSKETVTVLEIIQAASMGDELARNLLDESARYVGIATASVINMLKPEILIMGGILVNEYSHYLPQVKQIARSRVFTSFTEDIIITPSSFKEKAGVIGAGTFILEKYFQGSLEN